MPERIEKLCAEKRLKMTAQRRVIARVLAESADHPDVEELYRRATGIDPRISIATVYRTVKTLQQLGRLHRVHEQTGEHRFVARSASHSHMLVCRSCGRMVEFESCDLTVLEKLLEVETGYNIEGHDLELSGLCPQCRPSN